MGGGGRRGDEGVKGQYGRNKEQRATDRERQGVGEGERDGKSETDFSRTNKHGPNMASIYI